MAHIEDLWAERFARVLWVRGGDVPRPWPVLRAQCVRTRGTRAAPPGPLLLGYDVAQEAEAQRQRQAKQRALAKINAPPPPRRDVYVKGAMEWEKNAWRVWDKKKAQEEVRHDKYSTALTSYMAGNKIVVREEPFALSQCAHCDLGGGVHPLRRCMGCLAVSYCCRAHQAVHWQWHKHICFATRAANSLEARKGPGAGWVKLRPRRWKRPCIEKGAVVETNTRLRFASWKQFFTNGAQSMLNVMGDGGPLASREWDEAVASMSICEEATIVFSAGASARMQMPFIGARKAPPGTVVVAEIGLIDVRRDGGRRREVNEWLTTKFVEERKQKKLDQLEGAKLVRLRDRRDRLEQSDLVQRLLTSSHEQKLQALGWQKDRDDDDAPAPAPASAVAGTTDPAANPADAANKVTAEPSAAAAAAATDGDDDDGDKEVWEEEAEIDFEGFEEEEEEGGGGDVGGAAWAAFDLHHAAGDAAPLNLPSEASAADRSPQSADAIATGAAPPWGMTPEAPGATGAAGSELQPAPAACSPYDPWAAVDGMTVDDSRAIDAAARARAFAAPPPKVALPAAPTPAPLPATVPVPAPAPAPAPAPELAPAPAPELDLEALLSSLGLQQTLPNFERAGATVGGLRARAQAEPQALQKELGEMGLKMGQRQKMITALLH